MYRFQRARTTAISLRRPSIALASIVSSVPLTTGAGLAERNRLASVTERRLDEGGLGRKDWTKKLNAYAFVSAT
jgi:hypothetical protein